MVSEGKKREGAERDSGYSEAPDVVSYHGTLSKRADPCSTLLMVFYPLSVKPLRLIMCFLA